MDDWDDWARLLAVSTEAPASQPQRICELCVSALGVTGAGISLVTAEGNRGVVCATDDISARIEDLQFTLGEGPCVDAVRSGAPVILADLANPGDAAVDRWPTFMNAAAAAGVRAVFAFPLRIGAINVGALDLYRDQPGDLNRDQLPAALLAADAAAVALLHMGTAQQDLFTDDQESRASYQLQVHQATGMVQVQMGVSTDEAFLMLRARAFALGQPLVDVSSLVVQRRLRFTREDQ